MFVADRADLLLKDGDVGGSTVWRRILAAIEELQRKMREDEAVKSKAARRLIPFRHSVAGSAGLMREQACRAPPVENIERKASSSYSWILPRELSRWWHHPTFSLPMLLVVQKTLRYSPPLRSRLFAAYSWP